MGRSGHEPRRTAGRKALKAAGVECVFTLSGGHVMGIYDGCIDEGIRVVDVRHEQAAAHAADAWARLNPGRVGVAILTAGPGVTDGVTGVANAWRANSPILVIGGQGPFNNLRRGSLQEMDHVSVMKPITKWADACYETARLGEYVELAIRHALSGVPGPAFLEVPMDVLHSPLDLDTVEMPRFPRLPGRVDGARGADRRGGRHRERRDEPDGHGGHRAEVVRGRTGAAAFRRGDQHPGVHERHGPRAAVDESSAVLQPQPQGCAGPGRRGRAGGHTARLPDEVRRVDSGGREDRATRPRRDADRSEPVGRRRPRRQPRRESRCAGRGRGTPGRGRLLGTLGGAACDRGRRGADASRRNSTPTRSRSIRCGCVAGSPTSSRPTTR